MLSVTDNLFYEMDDGSPEFDMDQTTTDRLNYQANGYDVNASISSPASGKILNRTVGPDGQTNYALFNMQKSGNIDINKDNENVNMNFTRDNYGNVNATLSRNGTVVGNVQQDISGQSGLVDRAKFGINRAVNYTAHNPGTVAAGAAGAAALGYGAYRGIKSLNQNSNQQINQQQRH